MRMHLGLLEGLIRGNSDKAEICEVCREKTEGLKDELKRLRGELGEARAEIKHAWSVCAVYEDRYFREVAKNSALLRKEKEMLSDPDDLAQALAEKRRLESEVHRLEGEVDFWKRSFQGVQNVLERR